MRPHDGVVETYQFLGYSCNLTNLSVYLIQFGTPLTSKRFNSKGSQSKYFYHLAPTLWNDLLLAVREAESQVELYNHQSCRSHNKGHIFTYYTIYGQIGVTIKRQ